jgi:glycosyltransferase involved in cell wall biosynthesis
VAALEWLARAKAHAEETEVSGVVVYTPEWWLPKIYRPASVATLLARTRLERARRKLIGLGCRRIVLYIWRPEFAPALESVAHDVSCYHIDDEYSFSESEVSVSEQESRVIERADQVFVHSRTLFEKKGHLNRETRVVPNGVDYEAYAKKVEEPGDLACVPRPRIGYTGRIKSQLDWVLLLRLLTEHPEWSFVFVGPRAPHRDIDAIVEEARKRANVHFLGAKTVDELAAYPQHFDVCIMPYLANDYTKYIYPLKLHEYLASGRPTIGTRIPALERFDNVVRLVSNPEEWPRAIQEALTPEANTADRCAARQAVARCHDWDILVRRIAQTLAERLGVTLGTRSASSGNSILDRKSWL